MSNLTIKSFMESKQKIKPMSKDEEFKLIKLAQQGNRAAYDKMFKQWIPFIHRRVVCTKGKFDINNYYDDIMQDCSINFSHAIRKFDETKGKRFSTYLFNWIRQAIDDFMRKNTMKHYYSRFRFTQIVKYENAHRNLQQQLEKEPTVEELATYLGWSVKIVKNVQKSIFANNMISLDYISSSGLSLDELVSSDTEESVESTAEHTILQDKVSKILDKMNFRDKYILTSYYGLNNSETKPIAQLAKELEISDKMVYKAKVDAEKKFKYWCEKLNIKDFLN